MHGMAMARTTPTLSLHVSQAMVLPPFVVGGRGEELNLLA